MSRYMMFIKHKTDYADQTAPASLYEAMGEFVGDAIKQGIMIDGAGLKPLKYGKRVRLSKKKIDVIDGPFAEAKEIVGGYALMEFKSYDEAMKHARKFMELHLEHWPAFEGECEVRPLEDMPG